jgi:Ca-activated chloride channel family protein
MLPVSERARRLFAVGVPVLLCAVLVGCGQREKPEKVLATTAEKTSEEPEDKNLINEDPGLDSNLEGALVVKAGGGVMMSGTGGSFPGRSGATHSRLLREGGAAGPAAKPAPTGYNAQNAEAYGTYQENEFRSPLVAALSTFSADVNTASYSNVRRMLNDGNLPPASAVFLAEFVNYFPYRYAQPKGEDPVAFHVEMGPCPWNRKHHLVRIGVQAYQIPADKMPPRNLVFLIDTSGSMEAENRLPLVKKSLEQLVDQLAANDRVSIVTYAGEVNVSLVGAKGSEKDTIKTAVNKLIARGCTYGEGGIKKAYELARATFIDGGVNRVILCTDGDFNVGVTNQGELVKLIEEQRRTKVFLTILGFGMGNYKDQTLKELANHGNGHHAYIDTLDEAKKVFVEQGASLVCVAKDVKFQVDFNPAKVTAYRLIGYENRLLKDEDFKNDAKDAGDMGSGHQVTVLYEIVPKGVEIELPGVDPSKYQKKEPGGNFADEWLTVKMRYKHPEAETSKELSAVLKGAVAKELSDDFRFAAAAASFGMVLRDSKFRGAMSYTGVLEEATGCVGADPNGHRKQFLELVKTARQLDDAAKDVGPAQLAKAMGIDEVQLRALAEKLSDPAANPDRAKKIAEVMATVPPAYHAAAKKYFK